MSEIIQNNGSAAITYDPNALQTTATGQPVDSTPAGVAAAAAAAKQKAGTGKNAYWQKNGQSDYTLGASGVVDPNSVNARSVNTQASDQQLQQMTAAAGATVPSQDVLNHIQTKVTAAGANGQQAMDSVSKAALAAGPNPNAAQAAALKTAIKDASVQMSLGNVTNYSAMGMVYLAMRDTVHEQVKQGAYNLQVLRQSNAIASDISAYIQTLQKAQTDLEGQKKAKKNDTAYSNKQTVGVQAMSFSQFTGTKTDGHAASEIVKDAKTGSNITQMNNDQLTLAIKNGEKYAEQNNNQRDIGNQRFQAADSTRSSMMQTLVGLLKMFQDNGSQLIMNIHS